MPARTHVITRAGMVFGTPEYIPPEQALGQSSDGRADLYSLGVILFEMIAGVRPFVGETKLSLVGQHVGKPPPRVSERAPGLSVAREVEELVGRLLEKELQKRVQTAGEVVSAIDVLIGKSKRSPFRTPIIQKPLETLGVPAAPLDASLAARLDRRTDAPGPAERFRSFANDLVERSRRYWPKPLRTPLDRVPPLRLFLAALAVIVLVPVGLVLAARAALGPSAAGGRRAARRGAGRSARGARLERRVACGQRRRSAGSAPVARLRDPDEETLTAARRGGIDALRKLGERFPGSPVGELELARYYVANKDYVNAVSAIERALTVDPGGEERRPRRECAISNSAVESERGRGISPAARADEGARRGNRPRSGRLRPEGKPGSAAGRSVARLGWLFGGRAAAAACRGRPAAREKLRRGARASAAGKDRRRQAKSRLPRVFPAEARQVSVPEIGHAARRHDHCRRGACRKLERQRRASIRRVLARRAREIPGTASRPSPSSRSR